MPQGVDRFGNSHAEGLAYARGEVLSSTEDDYRKLRSAWKFIEKRRTAGQPIYNLTGLERSLASDQTSEVLDDEISPALYTDQLTDLGLAHLGGQQGRDDVLVTNRLTAAIYCAMQVMLPKEGTVVGVSAGYSHPAVVRAVRDAGGRLVDTVGIAEFSDEMAAADRVDVVALTRLAVTYDAIPNEDLAKITEIARSKGAQVFVDDAGGARVGPAILDQPRTLEMDVDGGATGLDKYGTIGPRLGLLAGRRDLVSAIRARAYELGMEARPMLYPAVVNSLEQYTVERVQELVASTQDVTYALQALLGDRVHETPVISQLPGEEILLEAMERAGIESPAIVPFEATAALAMLLLRDYGILTVHFAGLPPGTAALLIKFLPPETLAQLGGATAFAQAVDNSLDQLAQLLHDPAALQTLLISGTE